MSVIVSYSVLDLLKVTEKLMNILYASEWNTVLEVDSEEYYFNKIKLMHEKILKDSDITSYDTGASTLFEIANRLSAIEVALTGVTEPVDSVVTITKCIKRTENIINSMSGDRQRFCIIS